MSNILIEVNGIKYDGFIEAECSAGVERMSRQFRFSTSVKQNVQNDLRAQDKVKIFIDNKLFLTGKIETLNISYTPDSHTIEVSGRDQIGDLIDSSIIQKEYSQRDFLKLVTAVLKDNGYSNIKVLSNIETIAFIRLEEGEVVKTEKGETIAQFLDRYAQKVQVLMFSDESGNLVIAREGDEQAVGALLSNIGNSNSNILGASIDIDITDRFKFIELYSQSDNDSFVESSIDQSAIAIDTDITYPRRKRITKSTASKTISLSELAKWNIVIRKAKGSRYQCRVQDFYTSRDKGLLWQMNTLVMVSDDRCQIDGQFLIQNVKFFKSGAGTFTDLSIVNRGSFTLIDPKFLKSGDFAKNLIRK